MAYPEGSVRYGEEMRELLEAVVRRHPEGERAACHAAAGSPAAVLREASERLGADLVVVGAARRARLGTRILGTTAQRVLRSVGVPVLVARAALHRAPHRLLLTADLSELSAPVHERALDVLDGLYGLDFMELRSLLVVGVELVPPPLGREGLRRMARLELDRFLLARRARPLPVEASVRVGDVAAEIVEEAVEWNADLLVVGTHARHGWTRLWLGSVAEACIRDAPCSVLAVPPAQVAHDQEAAPPPAGAFAALAVPFGCLSGVSPGFSSTP
jgi:nucleotide-binding universal stress UspA family protein